MSTTCSLILISTFVTGSSVSKESIVDVKGSVKPVPKAIESCTQSTVELVIEEFWVVSLAEPRLPLQIDDASRPLLPEGDSQVWSCPT